MTGSPVQPPDTAPRDVAEAAPDEQALALRASEQRFRHLVETVNVVPYTWDVEACRYMYVGPQAERILGYAPERWTSETFWVSILHPDDTQRAIEHAAAFNADPRDEYLEYRVAAADGRTVWIRDIIKIDTDEAGRRVGYGMMFDITEAKERDALLQQAQKMEAVGQLTGGVAHDFNNLLTVIVGNIEMVSDQVSGAGRERLQSALRAAERGAGLVQQLLAFSRKLPLRHETADVNQIAAGMADRLRRTLGEEAEIAMKLHPSLWPVLTDRGQVESAILNLAINARDAMPGSGRLTIATDNVRLRDAEVARHADLTPGDYVMLAVSDTGSGMAKGVLERAVEPFFTTKEVGKGSGLGLSMIYGFAKQSRGNLTIDSTVGAGTTVRIYLPRQTAPSTAPSPARPATSEQPGGAETILVVEDDPLVRDFVALQLSDLGYRVLEAADGQQAQTLLASGVSVDLLFTDVVTSGGMAGRELAATARRLRPTLRTLYTSGYTREAILHQGKLEAGMHFLTKPYKRTELALKLREALDAPP